jgi:sterol desaturase/sphingolipid hydroxylase (fatty acid hydroxylase superfamily)
MFQRETVFHHSNLRLPVTIERLLNRVIVTPRMHGIHHSIVMEETNSNYSTIFRWWDVMHGSLNLGIRQSEVTIGVPAYSSPDDNGVLALNAMPFKRQRDYWKMPDGSHPVRPARDNKLIRVKIENV